MAIESSYELMIEGCEPRLCVSVVRGEERVHWPHRFEVTAEAVAPGGARAVLDVEALLARKAELIFAHEVAPRSIHGMVDAIEEVEAGYRFTLVPRIAALADRVDHRVFIDTDTVAIVKSVFDEHHLDVDVRVTRNLPKRPQCVQAFEEDLSFVSRLLAEEGILWHLEHDSGKDVIVLSDQAAGYPTIAGGDTLRFGDGEAAGLDGQESVFGTRLSRSMVTSRVALRDFDFERPTTDQSVDAGSAALEHFEFPGGYSDPNVGRALASIRLEEAKGRELVLTGTTTCRRLVPGSTFVLEGAPREDIDARWLVLAIAHRGSDFGAEAKEGRRHEAMFVAVPGEAPHRPARTRRPTLGGVQSAVVTGPKGAEIHTERHGRIKAQLRWDRLRASDDTSSQWLRPIQPPTSGAFFLPRMGWEVLLGFSRTSADSPYEVGRLYNGASPPPEGLPGQKVRSAFGTMTTPGGGSSNMLRMDDTAGNEGMTFQASKNLNERTENDKVVSVTGDDVHHVGANHGEIVGIVKAETVDGAQSYTVAARRDVTTVGRLTISAASESVAVGGLRLFQVGGDYETQCATLVRSVGGLKAEVAVQEVNRHVTGPSTVLVGGSWTEIGGITASTSVLASSTLTIAGPLTISAKDYSVKASVLEESYASLSTKAGAERKEGYKGAAAYTIDGSLTMKAGVVMFNAKSKITINAGGASITITSSSIDIKGDYNASGESVLGGNQTVG